MAKKVDSDCWQFDTTKAHKCILIIKTLNSDCQQYLVVKRIKAVFEKCTGYHYHVKMLDYMECPQCSALICRLVMANNMLKLHVVTLPHWLVAVTIRDEKSS